MYVRNIASLLSACLLGHVLQAGLIVTVISQYLDAAGMYCCLISFTSSDDNCEIRVYAGRVLHSTIERS